MLVLVAASLLATITHGQFIDTQFLGAVDVLRTYGNETGFEGFGELIKRADCDPGETVCPGM